MQQATALLDAAKARAARPVPAEWRQLTEWVCGAGTEGRILAAIAAAWSTDTDEARDALARFTALPEVAS